MLKCNIHSKFFPRCNRTKFSIQLELAKCNQYRTPSKCLMKHSISNANIVQKTNLRQCMRFRKCSIKLCEHQGTVLRDYLTGANFRLLLQFKVIVPSARARSGNFHKFFYSELLTLNFHVNKVRHWLVMIATTKLSDAINYHGIVLKVFYLLFLTVK